MTEEEYLHERDILYDASFSIDLSEIQETMDNMGSGDGLHGIEDLISAIRSRYETITSSIRTTFAYEGFKIETEDGGDGYDAFIRIIPWRYETMEACEKRLEKNRKASERRRATIAAKKADKDAKEFAEYERLKRKFG